MELRRQPFIFRSGLYTQAEMVFGFHLKVLSIFQGEDHRGEVIYEKSENHFVKSIKSYRINSLTK